MPSASVASSSGKAISPPLFTSDFDGELFEVLFETNLLQYYHNFAVDLKIYSMTDLRNLTDSELELVGLNAVEIRRLRRVVKKDNGHRPFFRLRKKFSFRASSRMSFDASGDRLSLFNPTPSHSGSSQDDSSSIFRASSSASGSSVRHSARHISLTRPAPPLLALLDPDLITLIPSKILGEGEFATVYQGVLRKDALTQDRDGMAGCMGLSASVPQSQIYKTLASDFAAYYLGDKSSKLMTVAIKKFAPNCLGRPLHVFLQHIALLSDLRHQHLLHVFGCYTDEYCQPALVCEVASLRSLIDVFSDPDLRMTITPMHLCRYAEQVACAMAYLEKRRVVHGDLACRNVMLSNISVDAQIKVADYGLLKALGVLLSGNGSHLNTSHQTPPSSSANSDDANSTSTDHSKLRLPVAWCAPETLRSVEMTSASDVWAFGVTLWEMFSYGEQPWSQLSATEILDAVDAPCGQRLAQPDFCPRDYYDDVMLRCWRHDASDRPTFAYLEQHMPLVRPDQVQTVKTSNPVLLAEEQEDDFGPLLGYSKGEILTVLDKRTGKQAYWKGVTGDGCIGYFCASDVVFYTDLLVPCSSGESATFRIAPTPPPTNLLPQTNLLKQNQTQTQPNHGYLVISPPPPEDNSVIYQALSEVNSKKESISEAQQSTKMPNESKKKGFGGVIPSIGSKTIDPSMISLPRGDLRHIGHIGFDGAVTGHVDFIAPGVERVCIERTSQSGTLPRPLHESTLKRSDSFEEGFQLPDLSIESEMQELISSIRLSDFLATAYPSESSNNKGRNESVPSSRGSASSFSKVGNGSSPVTQTESSQNMRQPRQPSGLLSNFDKVPSPTPLTMAFIKQSPATKDLKVEATALSSLLPGSSTNSTTSSSSPSSCSSNPSPCPPPNSVPISPTADNEVTKTAETNSQSEGLSSWRYVDSPPVAENVAEAVTAKLKQQQQQEPPALSVTTSTTIVGSQVMQGGQRRASIVTAEERQRVYEEVRQKCGHPLLMSDCLRAVSYTQGNVDAAVKFLKLQYLASHRVAEVERCKNALVACDWDVERALEMLRLRSSGESPANNTNFLTTTAPSDAVNV